MKHIVAVSDNYPSNEFPANGIFVYQLMQEMAKEYDVTVISPQVFMKGALARKEIYGAELCTVHRPRYLSFTVRSPYFIQCFSHYTKKRSVKMAVRNLAVNPDIIYAHFLSNAFLCIDLKKSHNIPIVAALGESNIYQYEKRQSLDELQKIVSHIDGFIVVSEKIREYCTKNLSIPASKILYAPNAVNTEIFYPNDRMKLRKNLKLPDHAFIISFLGSFIERKGIGELIEAVNNFEDVYLLAIGKGKLDKNPKILFASELPHYMVPQYLNASDIFVFPTKAEGSSNALLEAMACNLPVITTDIPEVVEQIGCDSAILFEPGNVEQLVKAIGKIKGDSLMKRSYADKSKRVAKQKDLDARARKISEWLMKIIDGTPKQLC